MRNDREALAVKAQQLLDNDIFKAAWGGAEQDLVDELKETEMNGSADSNAAVLECVRQLQALGNVRRKVTSRINAHALTQGQST